MLARLPDLKAIINLGAGVDHLLADPALPAVPVARVAHADLTMRVTEYVVLHVLMHHRRQRLYDAQQRERVWRVHDQPAASEVAVGVMGLGVIGRNAAAALARLGFKVAGWSRTPKTLSGVETFHGAAGLDAFLARTEILVCLLPRTPRPKGCSISRCCASSSAMARPAAHSCQRRPGASQVDADIVRRSTKARSPAQRSTCFRRSRLPHATARSGAIRR